MTITVFAAKVSNLATIIVFIGDFDLTVPNTNLARPVGASIATIEVQRLLSGVFPYFLAHDCPFFVSGGRHPAALVDHGREKFEYQFHSHVRPASAENARL